MKILMFYSPEFWFKTYEKVLPDVPVQDADTSVKNAVVVFYHAEAGDPEREGSVLKKFIKNIKWLAGKFGTTNVVLHSFNHLSTSKAPPDFTCSLIDNAKERLAGSGFIITETPFGYLNAWKMHVAGESLAKVFKDI
ncbi:MAG: Archaea-specific editing domain of threonyl-tRNA synthetase [Nitrospira bacterium SG8_35_4]|nr:MAG: Archaea-specific editing domain of threonyl-tRNA synthetase [Nitrospira bacterium SG8_35_4]